MDDNDDFDFDFENLGSETVNIQTLVTSTIMKNPKIIEVFQEISQQDASILEKKTNSFFKTTLKIDEITLIIYLCALMYENDIMPNYINSITEKLNMKIAINDLKNTAKNFINVLLNKKTDNLVGGSNFNFNSLKQILLHIAACLFISSMLYTDYKYYNDYLIPSTEKAINLVAKYKRIIGKVTDFDTQCNNFVPDSVLYINEYGINGFSALYKLSSCLASSENNIFFDENISKYNEILENSQNQNQNGLVPLESLNQVVVFTKIQEMDDFTNTICNKKILNKEDLYDAIKNTNNLLDTPNSVLVQRLTDINKKNTINIDESDIDEKSFFSTFKKGVKFMTDTGKLLYGVAGEFGGSPTVNPIDGFVIDIKKFLTVKVRQLEDLKIKSQRDFEDAVTEINNLITDVYAVTYMISILTFINSIVAKLLTYYFLLIFKKMTNLKLTNGNGSQLEVGDDQLQIENERLQIEDERLQIEDDPSKGGKGRTRRKRRKVMKRMKTMKRMKRMKTIKRKKQIKRKKSIKK
jgi:hypothetical protein